MFCGKMNMTLRATRTTIEVRESHRTVSYISTRTFFSIDLVSTENDFYTEQRQRHKNTNLCTETQLSGARV